MEPGGRYARMIGTSILTLRHRVVKFGHIEREEIKGGWIGAKKYHAASREWELWGAKILFLIMILPERLLRSEKMVGYQ